MPWFSGSRSLLLTGVADAWSATRDDPRGETLGLVLMVVSAASFALMAAFAKWLLADAPVQAVVFTRGVMMTTIFVAAARWQGAPIIGSRPWFVLLRGLLGYAALSCYFYSVKHLPLGDAVLLQYSHPIYVAILAPLLLGEPTHREDFALILLAIIGVALIVSPTGEVRPEALIGVLGSMLSGCAYIVVRRLAQTEHALTILVWFPLATVPFSLVASLAAGPAALPQNPRQIAGHLLVTLSALVGQLTLTHGLARARAARATGVTLTGPLFGLVYGYILFRTVPAPASIAGIAIVIIALGLLSWRSHLRARSGGGYS